jgi:Deoxyinosine 3''endonuclease (endonuclease V)
MEEKRNEQKRLAQEVRIRPLERRVRTIAGVDVSLERFGTELFAGVVVMSYPDLTPLHYATVRTPVSFPYIPGFLSFREMPGVIECLAKLPAPPDLVVVDGQGIAHPRRLGIASHLGVLLSVPTVGCAKSRLYGAFEVPKQVGDAEQILDPKSGDQIGWAFKSKERSNPLIVSPGHLVSMEESLEIIKNCLRGYRLPEPTRRAHELVNKFRKGELD